VADDVGVIDFAGCKESLSGGCGVFMDAGGDGLFGAACEGSSGRGIVASSR